MEDGFKVVSIIGVGLIGGSLALALKQRNLTNKIIGYGRNEERLKEALKLGIIDSYTTEIREASQAELIVLATPTSVFERIINEMLQFLKNGTIIIDVGSVKESIVNTFERILPKGILFVGTHPIAGSDKTGFENAKGDLFKNARVIITPTENTDKTALEKVSKLWQQIGAQVEFMTAEFHDKIYALVSHLPHLISFCMVNTVADINKNFIKYAGTGFKDSTRIAKSSAEVWRDIFIMNDKNIFQCLEVFTENLERIKKILSQKDLEGVNQFIEKANKLRQEID
ncbi:MAG: prephenate dehydrogenase [Thermodesulfovibrio sp.]|nr:prephenate dehydrogenase [Thermodesulfovibrio sp.]MDW7999294.1 prephenate dehydrogenase [Thermodesulfovibrio sp.]